MATRSAEAAGLSLLSHRMQKIPDLSDWSPNVARGHTRFRVAARIEDCTQQGPGSVSNRWK